MTNSRVFSVGAAEVEKLPLFRRVPTDGRVLPPLSFYDDRENQWHLYWESPGGKLGRIAGGEVVEGTYISRIAADPENDFEIPVGTFVTRHLSFPKVLPVVFEISHDISSFATVLAKYALVSKARRKSQLDSCAMIQCELEYLLTLARSTYDLLQKLAREIGELTRLPENPTKRAFQNLPSSFADVVLDRLDLRPTEKIGARYNLPRPLIEFYASEAAQFKLLRDVRDDIIHRGRQVPWVFALQDGLATGVGAPPWSKLPIWEPHLLRNGHLGSLRALFGYVIANTINVTTKYALALAASVRLPEALDDEARLYLRHPFSGLLTRLNEIAIDPWEGPPCDD
jgi:hypothetical protein